MKIVELLAAAGQWWSEDRIMWVELYKLDLNLVGVAFADKFARTSCFEFLYDLPSNWTLPPLSLDIEPNPFFAIPVI